MKSKTLLIFLLIFISLEVSSQEYKLFSEGTYWLTKWSTRGHLDVDTVTILMDTSDRGANLNQRFASSLANELEQKGVTAHVSFFGENEKQNGLVLKCKRIKSGKVKLSFFGPLPLCHKFEIKQINYFPFKENQQIFTTVSLSTVHEREAINRASKSLAKLISKSIQ